MRIPGSVLLVVSAALHAATTVVVDPGTRYQTMRGWGSSLCWFANMAGAFPEAKIDTLCRWITSPDELNMNVFRYNIGGGENPAHHHMRYDGATIPGFKASATSAYDWTRDANQRKILLRLNSLRPDVINQAFSNSPPYWMTKSGCASGNTDGSDNLLDGDYPAFAGYLAEVVKHYRDSLKITFQSLAPFNEPFSNWWKANKDQEGCGFSQANQNRLIPLVYDSLRSMGLAGSTKIAVADGNSIDQTLGGVQGYSAAGIAGKIGLVETHTYSGTKRTLLHDWAVANKSELWMDETGEGAPSNTMANALNLAQRLITDLRDLKPVVWCDWQVMTADDGMKFTGSDWGLVSAHYATDSMTKLPNYYVRKQCSRFIGPGSVIISTDQTNTVAALDSNGTHLVVVLCNQSTAVVPFTVDLTRFKSIGAATLFRTSGTENCVRSTGPNVNAGLAQYSSPAVSISTLVFPLQSAALQSKTFREISPFQVASGGHTVTVRLAQSTTGASYRVLDLDGSVLGSGPLQSSSTSFELPASSPRRFLVEVMDQGRRLGIQSVLRLDSESSKGGSP